MARGRRRNPPQPPTGYPLQPGYTPAERKLDVAKYLIKRLLRSFITLFIILSIVFVLVR